MTAGYVVRLGPVSARLRPRVWLGVLVIAAVLLLVAGLDIARGDYPISLHQVWITLCGGGTRAQRFIVFQSRLPGTATALVVGAGLGLAGAITQSVLRNPLASPDLLGVTAGASLGATAVTVWGGSLAAIGVPTAALAGGLATAVVLYLLAWRGRRVDPYRLVLIGIGVNAALTAAVGWLLTSARLEDAEHAQMWLNGSLAEANWDQLRPTAIGCALAATVALCAARPLTALRFDADTAVALGVAVQRDQAVLLLAATASAAVATAAVGPVVFVALAAGQLARMLLRTSGEPLVGSALVGALLLVGADVVARTVLPTPLPVGLVTAALGAPLLLLLLIRGRNRKATP